MHWVVPGQNTKVLAQAIHCLAKLGEDLYIEGKPEGLSFRTVNFSKTAFASFNFRPDFFAYYPTVQADDGLKCELSMKAALLVFRFPASMDKSVESCAIHLLPNEDVVQFELKYKMGFKKCNKIRLLEYEVLQSSYEDEVLPSRIKIDPKVLTNFLASFHCANITWSVNQDGAQFRNFSDLIDDDDAGLRSEVYVDKHELIDHDIETDTEFTFCLSELRTILSFAEHINCAIEVNFTGTGKPMFLIVRSEVLTAHVVLSTLGLSNTMSSEQSLSQMPSQTPPVRQKSENSLIDSIGSDSSNVLKRVLKRPSYDITKIPGYDQILAPDSDEEMQ